MKESIKKRIEAVNRDEVPEGYRVENGYLIANEWKTVPLNDRFTRSTRKNKAGCENVLTISAQMGLVNQREFYDKDIASEDKSGYFLMKNGEFAYNKSYSTGYPYGAIKQLTKYDEGIVSPLYICFAPKTGTDTAFYTQYFEGGRYNREIYRVAQEGARNHGLLNIAVEDFFTGTLVEPSAGEQQKIAEILATCDRVIELKQQLLEEKRRQKQWLMQKLLDPNSGVRIPGFECTKWAEKPLASICKFVGGGTPDTSNEHYWNGTIPWLSSADLQDGNVHSVQATRFITEEAVKNSATKICPKDSILIVSRVGVGKIAIAPVDLCTSQDFTNLVDVKGNLYFITLQIQREIQRILAMSQGTSIKGIASKEIKAVTINLPSRGEQDAIAKVVECSDKEIDLCEKEIEVWQQKKKAMMQLLLTGLVRVNA